MSDSNAFRDWMDARGLKADDVAAKFDVSPQTIAHWRSQGVPERRQSLVNYIMATWQDRTADVGEIRQNLVLRPTPEQFDSWNDAALAEGKRISDWALGGLDRLAAELEKIKPGTTKTTDRFRTVLNEEPERSNGTEGK